MKIPNDTRQGIIEYQMGLEMVVKYRNVLLYRIFTFRDDI
jgi:hypothetical protein